jgi:hypothetical protein
MIIMYQTSVRTPAGWRGVNIEAVAKKVSDGMAVVEQVIAINGEVAKSMMSRTGATRQRFHGLGVVSNEIGKRKRISACQIVEA